MGRKMSINIKFYYALETVKNFIIFSNVKIISQYLQESNLGLHPSRVAGTMVARSSSVRAIAHSNLSQVPPLHMHVGK